METLGQIAAARAIEARQGLGSNPPAAALCRRFGSIDGPMNATVAFPAEPRRIPGAVDTVVSLPVQHLPHLPQTTLELEAGSVEFLREELTKVAATRAAEGAAQEASFRTSVQARSYWNVAVTLPATLEAVTDAAMVRSFIDNRLMAQVMYEIDRLVGVQLSTSETDTARIVRPAGSINHGVDAAMSAVRRRGRARPTVVFAADDAVDAWEAADALQDKRIRYDDAGMPRYKGVPVQRSEVFDAANWACALSAPVHTEVLFSPRAVVSMSESNEPATGQHDLSQAAGHRARMDEGRARRLPPVGRCPGIDIVDAMLPHFIEAPAGSLAVPVSAAQVRAQLGIGTADETDAALDSIALSAAAQVENRTGLSIRSGSWKLRYEAFPLRRDWSRLTVPGYVQSLVSAALSDGTALDIAGVELLVSEDRAVAECRPNLTDGAWPDAWLPGEDMLQDVILTVTRGLTAAQCVGTVLSAILLRASIDYYGSHDDASLRAFGQLCESMRRI